MRKSAIFCLAIAAFLAATTLCSAKQLFRIPRWSPHPTEKGHHRHVTEGTKASSDASAVNHRLEGHSHDHHHGHHAEGPKHADDMEAHVVPLDDGMKLGIVDRHDDPMKLGYSNGHDIGFHHGNVGHHLGGPRHSGRGRPNFKLIGSYSGAGASSHSSHDHHHGAKEGKDVEGHPSDLVVEAPHRVHEEKPPMPPTYKMDHHEEPPAKAYKGSHHASSSSAAGSSSLNFNEGKYSGSSSMSMSKSHSSGDGVASSMSMSKSHSSGDGVGSSSFSFSKSVNH